MGEQPIYTTKAHVFQIDPQTKKNWIPASSVAVNVSYFFDSSRNTYRIISVDGTKAVINSIISPNMTFTKTSQKFGQWSDSRANTVYGLGFASEQDLHKFAEKFKEVKELSKQGPPSPGVPETTNGEEDHTPGTTPSRPGLHSRGSSISSDGSDRRSSGNIPTVDSQLKYENDRLKIALAQSSANAKKWEIELQTLKNNNARLTTALQESTSNVEEWKKQLAAYKEESARLKKRVVEMEQSQGSSDDVSSVKTQLQETQEQLKTIQQEKAQKDEEIQGLWRRIEEMSLNETQNQKNMDRIQSDQGELEKENDKLKNKIIELETLLRETKANQNKDRDDLLALHEDLSNKLKDLNTLHEKIMYHPSINHSDA